MLSDGKKRNFLIFFPEFRGRSHSLSAVLHRDEHNGAMLRYNIYTEKTIKEPQRSASLGLL